MSRGGERKNPKHDVGSMGTQISARGPVDDDDDFLYGAHLYPITTVGDRTLQWGHPSHCD